MSQWYLTTHTTAREMDTQLYITAHSFVQFRIKPVNTRVHTLHSRVWEGIL